MLTEQHPARLGTQTASALGGSAGAAALFTAWFAIYLGPAALIVFPVALTLITPVAILPAIVLYRLAVRFQRANDWTAGAGGMLLGGGVLLVGSVTRLRPAPTTTELLLFGVAGIAGGVSFWRGVRNETNASPTPPAPS